MSHIFNQNFAYNFKLIYSAKIHYITYKDLSAGSSFSVITGSSLDVITISPVSGISSKYNEYKIIELVYFDLYLQTFKQIIELIAHHSLVYTGFGSGDPDVP